MKLFKSKTPDYYDHGMREYPIVMRFAYGVVIWILFIFSKVQSKDIYQRRHHLSSMLLLDTICQV